jgi:predicted nucleotidyltransferase
VYRGRSGPAASWTTDRGGNRLAALSFDEMFIDDLRSRRREILSIAVRHGANDVRVVGSVLRGEDGPDSDLDLLVDVEEGRSLLDIIGLEQELGALLGRRVEVLTVGGLSPYLERQILAEAARL